MDMNNFFKRVNPNIPKDRQTLGLDPILHKEENSKFYIVTSSTDKKQIAFITKVLKVVTGVHVPFTLIYCFVYEPTEKDLKKNITKFVNKYSTNYTKLIPKGSKVLTLGRGIYTFTKEVDLTVSAFYSYRYTKTYFYHPETSSYIFPVDGITKLFNSSSKKVLDAFEYFFFKKQIQLAREFQVPKIRIPKMSYEIVENPNEFLTSYIGKDIEVAWDLETSGFIYYVDKIICITISFDGRKGYYLNFQDIDLEILNKFLEGKYQIGANLKFDCRFLRGRGVSNAKIDFDTLNAGHCLNETASNKLASHGWMYTHYGGHEIKLQDYKRAHPKLKNYSFIPKSILSEYASYDSVVCFQAYKTLKILLEEDPLLNDYYYRDVIPNLNLFLEIEMSGVEINWDYLLELQESFNKKKIELEEEIYDLLGFRVNLASNKDLPLALEHKANLPDLGMRGKKGYYLVNEETMTMWSKMDDWPVANKLLEYKSLCTQINTFIGSKKENNAYWQYRDSSLVHPTYSVMLAQSHRNKCQAPNLQQVPKKTKYAPVFRKIFIPPMQEDINFDLAKNSIRIELGDETLELLPTCLCLVKRENLNLEVEAKDLLETDDFQKVLLIRTIK